MNNNDEVGMIDFRASDGTDNMSKVAEIKASIDGTPGSNDMPGRLSFHTTADGANSSTERLRINSSGHVVPGADSSYDLGLTGTRWRNVYADTLYGDGSNLTGITQTTINSNADNRVITGSGTANTLNAESGLTFSDRLTIDTNINQKIILQGATHPYIHFS